MPLTENVTAVQFDHRVLATAALILIALMAGLGPRAGLPRSISIALAVAVAGQYELGVTTLLLVVPVPEATLHQAGAVILLTTVLVAWHRLLHGRLPDSPRAARPAPKPA